MKLTCRPGRPELVDSKTWLVHHADGRVSYCTIRRLEGGAPNGQTLTFEGRDRDEAHASYLAYLELQHDRTHRNAERRGKWGPDELRARQPEPGAARISDADMERCRQVGRARDQQKTGYASSRQLRAGGTNTAGMVGELVYGRVIGQEPDWELLAQGRRGADFGTTNVKCATRPVLHVSPENLAKDRAAGVETYALVLWREADQAAAYLGWVTALEVAAAPINEALPMPAHELRADRLHAGTAP